MWKSDLEVMVENDMVTRGYNPSSYDAVKLYWEMMLDGN